MVLIALGLFGIRPFSEPKRLSFNGGFNRVVGNNGSGKTMIYHVLSSLFLGTDASDIAFIENKKAKAAATFYANNGEIYRVARDYSKQAWDLSKMDAQANQFISMEKNAQKILDFLQIESGGMIEQERKRLFLLDRFGLPSHLPPSQRKGAIFVPGLVSGGTLPRRESSVSDTLPGQDELPLQTPEATAIDREAAEAISHKKTKLEAAEQELEGLSEFDDEMQIKLQQCQAIQRRMKQIAAIQTQLKNLEGEKASEFELLSADGPLSSDLIKSYEKSSTEKLTLFSEIEEEKALVGADLQDINERLEKRESFLLSGIIVIVLSFLLPLLFPLPGLFRYLFLVGLFGGIALSGWGLLNVSRRKKLKETIETKLFWLNEKMRQQDSHFEKEHRKVLQFTKKTGAKNVAALKILQSAFARHQKKAESAEADLERMLRGQSVEEMKIHASNLQKEADVLLIKIEASPINSEEVYRLQENLRNAEQREEERLETLKNTGNPQAETAIDHPIEAPNPLMEATFTGLPGLSPLDTGFLGANEDVLEQSFVSEILSMGSGDPAARFETLKSDANRLFSRLQPDLGASLAFGLSGEVLLDGTPFYQLSAGLADQVFLSVTLSALNQFPEVSFPILMDDPFPTLDAASKREVLTVLEEISKKRQILLFSAEEEAAEGINLIKLAA